MEQYVGSMAIIFGITLLVSLVLTPWVRRVAVRRGLLDMPGEERRVHKVPIPRLGGLAMFAAFAVGILLTFALSVRDLDKKHGNELFETNCVWLLLWARALLRW